MRPCPRACSPPASSALENTPPVPSARAEHPFPAIRRGVWLRARVPGPWGWQRACPGPALPRRLCVERAAGRRPQRREARGQLAAQSQGLALHPRRAGPGPPSTCGRRSLTRPRPGAVTQPIPAVRA